MLRIVHPPSGGQGTATPKRRKGARAPALSLSAEEVRHVRAALTNTARAYGGADVLAAAMGVPVGRLYAVAKRRRPSGTLAIRLAAAAGSTVEAMLSGTLTVAARAPLKGGAS